MRCEALAGAFAAEAACIRSCFSPAEILQIQIPAPEQPDEAAAAEFKRKGDVAFVAKQYGEALQAYNQCLKHSTSNHVVWANRSAVLLRLNKHQAALEDARRARTLDETYTKVRTSQRAQFMSGS